MTEQSETPRTNTAVREECGFGGSFIVQAEFARTLERELNESKEKERAWMTKWDDAQRELTAKTSECEEWKIAEQNQREQCGGERRELNRVRAELEQLQSRLSRYETVLQDVFDILDAAPEINPSNYDHEQVCKLNSNAIQAFLLLKQALAKPDEAKGGAG